MGQRLVLLRRSLTHVSTHRIKEPDVPEQTIEEVQSALAPVCDSLSADGYKLEVTDAAERLSLKVTALENACEECLVPQHVMAMMVSAKLDGAYEPEDIAIEYPA
jgi:hypothetical protein